MSKKDINKAVVSVYFGLPGSGKSTYAAYLAKCCQKMDIDVYSNVPIAGCYRLNCKEDLGVYSVENAKIIIDEAGLEFNNRDFKSFPKNVLEFMKLHRHAHTSIDVFSQSWSDMDLKIRQLAQRYFLVKRSRIPYFVKIVPIHKRVGVNELTKEICDEYYFVPGILGLFEAKRVFMPSVWDMFDSYEMPKYEKKQFEKFPFPVQSKKKRSRRSPRRKKKENLWRSESWWGEEEK